MKVCKVKGCNLRVEAFGYCQKHYKRYKKDDNPHLRSRKDINEYSIQGDIIEISIYSDRDEIGKCIIDRDKEDILLRAFKDNRNIYLSNYICITAKKGDNRRKTPFVHELFGVPGDDMVYTYKDNNIFNLKKSNIEIISQTEQSRRRVANSERIVGVTKYKDKWIVRINNNNKNIYLGSYDDYTDAIKIRLEAEEKYWGKVYQKIDLTNMKKYFK